MVEGRYGPEMIVQIWEHWDAAMALRAAGACIIVGGSMVAGHRLFVIARGPVPALGRLHPDTGAWAGLVVGVVSIML
jgi:hypothetical protein